MIGMIPWYVFALPLSTPLRINESGAFRGLGQGNISYGAFRYDAFV